MLKKKSRYKERLDEIKFVQTFKFSAIEIVSVVRDSVFVVRSRVGGESKTAISLESAFVAFCRPDSNRFSMLEE